MKKSVLTKYLAVFLLICIVLDGILLCFFSKKDWWSNWMVTGPNLYMVLGAFYCHFMKKNAETHPNKLAWLYVFKGIKILLTIAAIVLYLVFANETITKDVMNSKRAFIIVTASASLIALTTETIVYTHYTKNSNKANKA